MIKWFILFTLLTMDDIAPANCQPKTVPGLTMVKLPIALTTMSGTKLTSIWCHRSMSIPLTVALACVKLSGIELTTGGCFCYRNIAGTNRLSRHASGTAIDINPGKVVPQRVVECFESAGFGWGGHWPEATYDPMHFELKGTTDEPNDFYTPTLRINLIPRDPG